MSAGTLRERLEGAELDAEVDFDGRLPASVDALILVAREAVSDAEQSASAPLPVAECVGIMVAVLVDGVPGARFMVQDDGDARGVTLSLVWHPAEIQRLAGDPITFAGYVSRSDATALETREAARLLVEKLHAAKIQGVEYLRKIRKVNQ